MEYYNYDLQNCNLQPYPNLFVRHVYNTRSPESITLDSEDALYLNAMNIIFGGTRPVIYRNSRGRLYACTDTTTSDRVHIRDTMLPGIPRNKLIDTRQLLNKRKR